MSSSNFWQPTRSMASIIDRFGFAGVFGAITYALYLVFVLVPNERVMGPVQRIFYFHVGSAIACYCAFGVVLVASLTFLATRNRLADIVSEAAGEVGFIFCTIVLLTGMIWGHSAWNTWFRWEPRLVTFLLLWIIFLSFNALRMFGDRERVAMHSSVLGILGAVTVPLVVFSIHFLPQSAQLHPQVVGNRGLKDPLFEQALLVSTMALVALQFYLVWIRTRIGILERVKE
jgi:heme exporter protein C